MISLIGKLFGTEKALRTIVDGVSDGLDKLVYTDEEKAQDAAKDRSEARAMVVDWMKSTSGQNLARRLIALSVTALWIFTYVAAMFLDVAAIWVDNPEPIYQTAKVMRSGAGDMVPAVMLILGFYFAAPHMGAIASSAVQAFGDRMKRHEDRSG